MLSPDLLIGVPVPSHPGDWPDTHQQVETVIGLGESSWAELPTPFLSNEGTGTVPGNTTCPQGPWLPTRVLTEHHSTVPRAGPHVRGLYLQAEAYSPALGIYFFPARLSQDIAWEFPLWLRGNKPN